MEREVMQIAKDERRSVSEVLREAFRQYMTNRDGSLIRAEGRKVVKKRKLKPEDVLRMTRETREEMSRERWQRLLR